MSSFLKQITIATDPKHEVEEVIGLLSEIKDYAILTIDISGKVSRLSFGAKHIYGYDSDEITGKNVSIFYLQEDQENAKPEEDLKKAEKTGRFEYEGWKQRKDGSHFYANTIITARYNLDGSVAGFAKVTRDISVQKKLKEENIILTQQLEEKVLQRTKELAVVNSELEAFSYSVSHDLRTPLRAISGYAIMLQEDYEGQLDAEGRRILNVIISNTKMMGQLIDDLLAFSKLSRLEIVNHSIDMTALAENCVAELLPIQPRKDYHISIDKMPQCTGDSNMLRQVWCNLIGNALKYTSKKTNPRLEVGAVDDSDNNIYYVKDNGSGFDMKYSNKLFGVFQRLHRHDEFEGTGLGLALAKRIITKHGGEITAEAKLNEGATFYFSIPKNIDNATEIR